MHFFISRLERTNFLYERVLHFAGLAISMCCCLNEKPFIGCLNAAMDRNLLEGWKNVPRSCFLFMSNLPLSTDTLHLWTWRRFTVRLVPSECSLIFSSVPIQQSFCWQTKDGFVELDNAVCTSALRETHMGSTKEGESISWNCSVDQRRPFLRYAGTPLHKLWHVTNCQHLHQPRAIMCSLETGERDLIWFGWWWRWQDVRLMEMKKKMGLQALLQNTETCFMMDLPGRLTIWTTQMLLSLLIMVLTLLKVRSSKLKIPKVFWSYACTIKWILTDYPFFPLRCEWMWGDKWRVWGSLL